MEKFIKTFAITVAIVSVVVLVLQAVNAIHMLGGNLTYGGQQLVNMQESQTWEFVHVINTWWSWIVKIVSVIFLLWLVVRKKNNTHEDYESGMQRNLT